MGGTRRSWATSATWRLRWPAGWTTCRPGSGAPPSPRAAPSRSAAYRARRFAELLVLDPRHRYAGWLACFREPQKAELYTPELRQEVGAVDSLAILEAAWDASDGSSVVERAAHTDVQLYLPDD